MTNYAGIDYGMGRVNIDPKTGIRFGVINIRALNEWAHEDFEADYGAPHCPKCGNEAQEGEGKSKSHDDGSVSVWTEHPAHTEDWECSGCGDYRCDECEYLFDADEAFGDDPIGHTLDDGTYKATMGEYGDIFLMESPYFTHAQFCSPCAPGAGHLENPCANGPRTYCFGHDWFEGGRAPYPVYRVSDKRRIRAPKKK